MADTRFKYLCKFDDENNLRSREQWRHDFLAAKAGENFSRAEASTSIDMTGEERPTAGKEVFVEILTKKEFYEIIWEDGTVEERVSPSDLISAHCYTDAGGNLVTIPGNFGSLHATFHPGMYVTTTGRQEVIATPTVIDQGSSASHSSPSASLGLPTKTSLLPQGLIAALKKSQLAEDSNLDNLQQFGIVSKCSTKEKFATVKWYKVRGAVSWYCGIDLCHF